MSKIKVDYEKLNSVKNNADIATLQASSIASKINGIYSGLDGRVRGMVSGMQSLISGFEAVEGKLSQFSENIVNTIYQIQWLEETQSNMDFTSKLFLEANSTGNFEISSILNNQNGIADVCLEMLSKYLSQDQIDLLKTNKEFKGNEKYLKNCRKLYNWALNNKGNLCWEFYKKDNTLYNAFIPMMAETLQTIVNRDCISSNVQNPKQRAVIYANVASSNPIVHFGYGYSGSQAVFGDGFKELLETRKTDCIGFVKWSYYQAIKDEYADNPEKVEDLKKNFDFHIIGLMESGYKNGEGTYEVNGDKSKEIENQEEYIANFIEPGDVIATIRGKDEDSLHIRMIISVDKETGTFITAESTATQGFYKTERSISKSLIGAWTEGDRRAVIVKGDNIISYIMNDNEEAIDDEK